MPTSTFTDKTTQTPGPGTRVGSDSRDIPCPPPPSARGFSWELAEVAGGALIGLVVSALVAH